MVRLASDALALLGALGSQLINAVFALRVKRLDLVCVRTAEAYRFFMARAATSGMIRGMQHRTDNSYTLTLPSTLVCSEYALKVLGGDGEPGLYKTAQYLATASNMRMA